MTARWATRWWSCAADGVQAPGRELTAFGWGLYDFGTADEHLFVPLPAAEKVTDSLCAARIVVNSGIRRAV